MNATQGGPPPGWPSAAVPRLAPQVEAPVAPTSELAFPPVEPGFKRGVQRTLVMTPAATSPVVTAPQPAMSPVVVPAASAESALLTTNLSAGATHSFAPTHGAPQPTPTTSTTGGLDAIAVLPLDAPPPPLGLDATGATRDASPAPRPPPTAYAPPASRSRLVVLGIIGAVLIGGTAIGSFLYLRSSSASPKDESSAARPKRSKKGAPSATPAASAPHPGSADEPVVEDTPTPTMKPDTETPSESPPTAEATASAAPPKRPLPIRRLQGVPKR